MRHTSAQKASMCRPEYRHRWRAVPPQSQQRPDPAVTGALNGRGGACGGHGRACGAAGGRGTGRGARGTAGACLALQAATRHRGEQHRCGDPREAFLAIGCRQNSHILRV